MKRSMKSETTPALNWQFEAIGTQWEIVSSDALTERVRQGVLELIEKFDMAYSRFRSDSLVSKLANEGGTVLFPESAAKIFAVYDDLFRLTDAKVTPLVGDALVAAGYDQAYSLKPQAAPASTLNYEEAVVRKGREVTVTQPTWIDIGAVGKGYLVDEVTEFLVHSGHTDFVVDASGDMRVVGERREKVGLENPHDLTEVIGAVEVTNAALCASAINRRAWGDWHHVIDPTTSLPTKDVVATWVIADSAMIADGLATSLFFTDPKKLASTYNYEYIRLNADGSVEYSEYFAKGVFL